MVIFGQKWIFSKIDCQFLDFIIIYHHANNQKNVVSGYQAKPLRDRQTDKWLFHRTLNLRGSKKTCFTEKYNSTKTKIILLKVLHKEDLAKCFEKTKKKHCCFKSDWFTRSRETVRSKMSLLNMNYFFKPFQG